MKRWRDDNALWRENPSRWPLPAERDAHNGRCYVHGAKAMPELAQAVRSGAMSINAGAAIAAGRYAHARGWILPLATNPLLWGQHRGQAPTWQAQGRHRAIFEAYLAEECSASWLACASRD